MLSLNYYLPIYKNLKPCCVPRLDFLKDLCSCLLLKNKSSSLLIVFHTNNIRMPSVRPYVKFKSGLIFFLQKLPKKYQQQFLIQKWCFVKAQNLPSIWATFVSKFATKNFQKSPNLVILNAMAKHTARHCPS